VNKFIAELIFSLKRNGCFETLSALWKSPLSEYKYKKKREKIFILKEAEDIFTQIYKLNYWDNKESASGSGSTLRYTENLRNELPKIFDGIAIKSILDAPCGDFNWFPYMLKEYSLDYTGADIVADLVRVNNDQFSDKMTRFVHLDIRRDELPSVDLLFCRDCLFHFSYSDTREFIQNFLRSDIKYLFTTTHINDGSFENQDIGTGDYRLIDLFSHPYNFPRNILAQVDDWYFPEPRREMCLWSREQLLGISKLCL
jgi:SAM-dependent methyltransferase